MTNNIAQRKAQEFGHANVEPAHVLWSLLHESSPLLPGLEGVGIDLLYARDWAEMRMEEATRAKGDPGAPEPAASVEKALAEAKRYEARFPESDLGRSAALLAALTKPGVAFTKEDLHSFPLTEKLTLEIFGEAEDPKSNGTQTTNGAKPTKGGGVLAV